MNKKMIFNQRWGYCLLLAVLLISLTGASPYPRPAPNQASYIVQVGSADEAAQLVESSGGAVTSRLDIVDGVGALLSPDALAQLKQNPAVLAITPNSSVRLVDDGGGDDVEGGKGNASPATDYPDVTGADLVWKARDNGSGLSVAVLDTGIGKHRGLVQNTNGKPGHIVGWVDFVSGKRTPIDPNGHGTHVAGIIANTQMGTDQEWDGMAPGADLVGVRVLDENGSGTYENVIRGLQWVLENKDRYDIRVVNMSLVSTATTPYWADPMNQAIMKVWSKGLTVVVAAGNNGPGPMTIGVPGNNPYVITVGAFTDNYTPANWNDDSIAPFSAAGPTLDGFVKPDVIAPGAHMVSTMLPNTVLAKNHQANQVSNQYFSMAGTSQSTAVVSGIAALVLSQHSRLSPDEVKFRIMDTALPWMDPTTHAAGYSLWQQGSGRVNARDAVLADIHGQANKGMDIKADMAGKKHYEGFTVYDPATKEFRLKGDMTDWANGFGAWSGGFGAWSGGFGAWSGGFGAWSGGFGAWSGGFGAWSGGFGAWSGTVDWSGGFGAWSGGFGAWSGGFGAWSGGFGAWSGSEPWAGSAIADPTFVANFMAGKGKDTASSETTINRWVEEP